jgi:hypothetical protein
MKYIFYFLSIAMVSCSSVSDTESNLYGKWEYEKITRADTNLMKISQGDEMELFIDYVFTYHIDKANKHATGMWRLYGDTLKFTYEPDDKVRNFIIDELSEEQLVFHEGDVYFHYNKED